MSDIGFLLENTGLPSGVTVTQTEGPTYTIEDSNGNKIILSENGIEILDIFSNEILMNSTGITFDSPENLTFNVTGSESLEFNGSPSGGGIGFLGQAGGGGTTITDESPSGIEITGSNGGISLSGNGNGPDAPLAIGVPDDAIAFFGHSAITEPTVHGALSAVTDANAKAVLTSLLEALNDNVGLGLLSQQTT